MVKFNSVKLFEFYCEALEACGVEIHKSYHFYYGDKDEDNGWPEGYNLFMLFYLTYKNKTGWHYILADQCPGCWPSCCFNGYGKYGDLEDQEERNRLSSEFYELCTEEAIPEEDLLFFVNMHFREERNCDSCHGPLPGEEYTLYTCTECTEMLVAANTYPVCEKCIPSHDINHTLSEITMVEEDMCSVCYEEIPKIHMVCQQCLEESHVIDICEKCSKEEGDLPVHYDDFIHTSEHTIKLVDDDPLCKICTDTEILVNKINKVFEKESDIPQEKLSEVSNFCYSN